MFIDLTCPAEIFRTALPTEENPAAALVLYNLSDRVIVSAEVTLRLLDKGGEEREKLVYRARALNGRPHSTFPMTVPCPPAATASSAEAVIEKIWFADNAVWRRDSVNAVEFAPNNLPVSPSLTALKYVAGETAVGFPSQQDGVWVCVCGRPNPDSAEYCVRCRRQKDMIFTRYNREAVEKQLAQKEWQLELNTRNAREDTARLQRIREEEYNRAQNRKSRRIRLVLCTLATLLICALCLAGVLPELRLISGGKALKEGRLEDAEALFVSLGNFGNAREQLSETRFLSAKKAAEEGTEPETLATAAKALRDMTDREEALQLADEAEIRLGRILLEKGEWAKAREAALRSRDDSEGRRALLDDCTFAEAKACLDMANYTAARELFLSLGDYEGAANLASECIYEPTLQKIENGDYDEAIAALSTITGYEDSRTLILKCHYLKGLAAEKAGDVTSAAEEYLMAADYEDAREKSMAMIYAQAEAARAAGDIAAAAQLYSSVPDYPGAREKSWECFYALAKRSYKDAEYLRTLELLESVPDEYESTGTIRKKSAYLAGTAAAKRKDWQSAVSLLETAGDYRNAGKDLEKARQALIREMLDSGDPDGAAVQIALLPDGNTKEALSKELDALLPKPEPVSEPEPGTEAGPDIPTETAEAPEEPNAPETPESEQPAEAQSFIVADEE